MRVNETYVLLSVLALIGTGLLGGWRLAARITRLVDSVDASTIEVRKLRHRGHKQDRRLDDVERRVDMLEAAERRR